MKRINQLIRFKRVWYEFGAVFSVIDDALKQILDFHAAVKKYKEHVDESQYQDINQKLCDKRYKKEESVDTRLNLLSDVTNNYVKINTFNEQIKNSYPVSIYGESLHEVLVYLKQDIELYEAEAKPDGEEKNFA